ncbi:MAG: right-handed parallel beta-helix repeat-containing protein [Myxococcales bacterium]|nr:right-handed parallel beta-helix repeat-containing protein [Myxococcales bacterium]
MIPPWIDLGLLAFPALLLACQGEGLEGGRFRPGDLDGAIPAPPTDGGSGSTSDDAAKDGSTDGSQSTDGEAPPACFPWSGTPAINDTIATHDCVSVMPGTYPVTRPIRVLSGKTLRGHSTDRTQATFVAAPGFTGSQLLTDDLTRRKTATIRNLTFDAAGRTNGVGARFMTFIDVVVKNATCWGVAVAGPSFRMDKSDIHHNGADPGCPAKPGGGIYIVNQNANGPGRYAPVITNSQIHDNTGPGFDIAGVWDGVLRQAFRKDSPTGPSAGAAPTAPIRRPS